MKGLGRNQVSREEQGKQNVSLPDSYTPSKSIKTKVSAKWAILASFLFALSTPPAKILSSEQTPFILSGLFYLGSILGIIPSILSGIINRSGSFFSKGQKEWQKITKMFW
jgi:hypothetical protein